MSSPVAARKIVWLFAASFCLLGIGPAAAQGAQMEAAGFQDEPVISGLEEPSNFRFSPDGRVFVAEKTGKILVYDGVEDETATVFADLRTDVYDTGDRGILGLALDPNFPAKPYVYVLYTYDHILGDPAAPPKWGGEETSGDPCPELHESDACLVSGRVVRLTAEGDHAAGGALTPQQDQLVEGWCQQFSSHSIGDLQFGPEGALYASGGDGASFSHVDRGQLGDPENPCGDPPNEGGALRAQDVRTVADPTGLNGSVIRIDPETGAGWPGNPLATSADPNARRIVAFGLRNPFRFVIDPATHEVYVGNVGWNDYEEIDRFNPAAEAPYNSGWPCYEGPERQLNYESAHLSLCESLYASPGAAAQPFFSYRHRQGLTAGDPCLDFRGSAISGFAFYGEGPFPPSYQGAMFFSDSVRGCIYAMFPGADGRPDPSTVTTFMTHSDPYSGTDLEVGPDGDLYYASLFTEKEGNEFEPGAIHRIGYFSGNKPPVARLSVDHQWGPEHLESTFDASGSSDADDDPLEYEWDLNGDGSYAAPTTDSTATETFEDDENHTVAVRVVDPSEASSVARVTVYPGDTPPEPEIVSPTRAFEWSVGQPVEFQGSAEDAEDGDLPATSFDWVSRLYHCPQACHAHPLQAFPSVSAGSFLAPEHDLPSHIELTLTAVDSRGLSAQASVEIEPRIAALEIVSNPAGILLDAGLLSRPAPFTLPVIAGTKVPLSAPASVQVDGVAYTWKRWSDEGARVHEASPAGPTRYEAFYEGPPQEVPPLVKDPPLGLTLHAPLPSPQGVGPGGLKIHIDKHPHKHSHSRTATFAFSSSLPDTRFRCKIDDGHFAPCRSPRSYMHMSLGKHSFELTAVDPSGAPVGTPLAYRWRVVS